MLSFPPGQVCPGYHSAAFLVCLFSGGRMYSGFTVLNMAVVVLVLLWDRLALEMCNALHGCLGLLLQLQDRKTELIRKCDWIHVSFIFCHKILEWKNRKIFNNFFTTTRTCNISGVPIQEVWTRYPFKRPEFVFWEYYSKWDQLAYWLKQKASLSAKERNHRHIIIKFNQENWDWISNTTFGESDINVAWPIQPHSFKVFGPFWQNQLKNFNSRNPFRAGIGRSSDFPSSVLQFTHVLSMISFRS